MANVLNIGLIGCGSIMGAHVDGLKRLWERGYRAFSIPAVCDSEQSRAEEIASRLMAWQETKPCVYLDFEEMLAKEPTLDAVDLALPHRSHHTVAVQCLRAGKHMTIEKPLGITMRACHAIIEEAQKQRLILQVAENYRRAPHERAINWAIKQGMIGELRMIFWIDVGERLFHWGWRDDVNVAGGGWSLDGGVHFADLFRYHIGEVKELYAVSKAYHPIRYRKPDTREDPIPATTEDTTVAVLTFESGVTGQWTSTSAAPGYKFSDRVVYGSEGSIKWGDGLHTRTSRISMDDLIEMHKKAISSEERERLFPLGITDTISTELHEFIEACFHRVHVEIDGVEGMKDEAISMALYESAALDAPVEIKKVETCEIEEYQRVLNESLGL